MNTKISYLVGRRRCPKCAKENRDRHGDNLGIFSDGHEYCFSCAYQKGANITVHSVKERLNGLRSNDSNDIVNTLPDDSKQEIDIVGLKWLAKYGLTPEEISDNYLWSDAEQQLIFYTTNEEGQLLFTHARNFREGRRKYDTQGNVRDSIVILGEGSIVVLVEDVVSAIKIARHSIAIPLFCTDASVQFLRRLKTLGYTDFKVWLDGNAMKQAAKITRRISMLGLRGETIVTVDDPKDHTDDQIRKLIGLV